MAAAHPTCPPAASPPFGRLSASIQLILLLLQLDVDHGLLLLEQLQPLLLRPWTILCSILLPCDRLRRRGDLPDLLRQGELSPVPGVIGGVKPVLVQSHVVRDQVEYPQPELIVFFGVLATADKQYWKKFATFDFSDWTSKSWIQPDTVLKTNSGSSPQSTNKSLKLLPPMVEETSCSSTSFLPWALVIPKDQGQITSLIMVCSLENNPVGPRDFVVLSDQGNIRELT